MMHLASEITLPYQINKKCFMEIALTDLQREVLVGILLGDAHLRTNRKRDKASLVVLQGDAHKPYVFHLYNIFKPLPSAAPRFYSFSDKRAPGKSYGRWSFQTPMLKCLAPLCRKLLRQGQQEASSPRDRKHAECTWCCVLVHGRWGCKMERQGQSCSFLLRLLL